MSIKRLKIKRVKGNVVRVKKGGEHMDANGRYCSVLESIEESLQEVKLMREGKIEKRSYWL